MQVPVPGMAKGLDGQPAFSAGFVDKLQVVGNLIYGDDDVAFIQQFSLFHDCFQERRARGPGILDFARRVGNQYVDGAFFQHEFCSLFYQGVYFIFGSSVQRYQQVSPNLRSFQFLREYRFADVALRGQDDFAFHKFYGLRVHMRHLKFGDGSKGCVQVFEGDNQGSCRLGGGDDF